MQFPRVVFVALFVACTLFCGRTASAQNFITVCSEQDLINAFGAGGEWTIECVSNLVTIPITQPLIATKPVTIRTVGTNEVILNGSNVTRILVIQPNIKVTLEGFAIFNGRQTGTNENSGGIEETAGGAIYVDRGELEFLRGRLSNNSVVGITGSPGEDGTGENGEDGGDAAGAAIYNNSGVVSVSNVVFNANVATAGAGGKGANAQTGGLGGIGGNGGNGGSAAGAAIYSNGGTNIVQACTFTGTSATGAAPGAGGSTSGLLGVPGRPGQPGDGVGAAISGRNAVIEISGCTFNNNNVRGASGLNGNAGVGRNDGDPGGTGGEAAGGAIYFLRETAGGLSVTNSTFFLNTATSGNGGAGGAGSSDGFGFNGGEGGSGGVASGGAIDAKGGSASIVHCTFSDNILTGGTGGAGGAGSGLGEDGDAGSRGPTLGGAVNGVSGQVMVANSIFNNSQVSLAGSVEDRGGNITSDDNPLIKTNLGSLKSTSPLLQPLANNGGRTQTMAIRTNSPAIDRGIAQFCVAFDQRGTNRVRCDSGAFEAAFASSSSVTNLQATFSTNRTMLLQWPAGFTNLTLQTAPALLRTNTVWTPVTSGVTVTNTTNFFRVAPITNVPRSFYRLFNSTAPTSTNSIVPPPTLPD